MKRLSIIILFVLFQLTAFCQSGSLSLTDYYPIIKKDTSVVLDKSESITTHISLAISPQENFPHRKLSEFLNWTEWQFDEFVVKAKREYKCPRKNTKCIDVRVTTGGRVYDYTFAEFKKVAY